MNYQEVVMNYERYRVALLNKAFFFTKNKEAAQDLLQDTLLKMLKKANSYMPGTNFKAWANTIMFNTFINQNRRVGRFREIMQQLRDRPLQQLSAWNQGESFLQYEELLKLVQQLDPLYRVPFLMSYRGYSYLEIADHLDIPLGTAKSRIFVARRKLKTQIEQRYAQRSNAGQG